MAAVLRQNVALDLYDPLLAQAGDMDARQPRAEIELFRPIAMGMRVMTVIVVMFVDMFVIVSVSVMVMVAMFVRMIMIAPMVVIMRMVVRVIMAMIAMRMAMAVRLALFGLLAVFLGRRPASANRAHYSTSSSLTRISSPATICT
jgi:hypothetical protein